MQIVDSVDSIPRTSNTGGYEYGENISKCDALKPVGMGLLMSRMTSLSLSPAARVRLGLGNNSARVVNVCRNVSAVLALDLRVLIAIFGALF